MMSRTLWHTTPQCVARVEKPVLNRKKRLTVKSFWSIVFTVYRVLQPLSEDTNVSSKFAFLFSRYF